MTVYEEPRVAVGTHVEERVAARPSAQRVAARERRVSAAILGLFGVVEVAWLMLLGYAAYQFI